MSNRYWSKWGKPIAGGQTVGFDVNYYIKCETGDIVVAFPDEIDDLIYQLMRLKRKAEGE